MKYLFFLFAISFVCQQVDAQIIIYGYKQDEPAPLLKDYEIYLNRFKKVAEKTFNGGYKDLKLTHRTTQEEKKISDLSTQEQNLLILDLAAKQTKYMAHLQKEWFLELKKFEQPNYKPKAIGEDKPALKADVEKYINQLLELRKKYASDYEVFAEKSLSEIDKLNKKEINSELSLIRSFHDSEKLIERKKE